MLTALDHFLVMHVGRDGHQNETFHLFRDRVEVDWLDLSWVLTLPVFEDLGDAFFYSSGTSPDLHEISKKCL